MSDDPFSAIKAQLDTQAKWWAEARERAEARRIWLRAALAQIAALKPDNEGNSTRLAIRIAGEALDHEDRNHMDFG